MNLRLHLKCLRSMLSTARPEDHADVLQFAVQSLSDEVLDLCERPPSQEGVKASPLTKRVNRAFDLEASKWDDLLRRKDGTMRPHGTSTAYQRGCRCETCKTVQRAYNQAFHAKKKAQAEATAEAPEPAKRGRKSPEAKP